jgi:hypothetical protein
MSRKSADRERIRRLREAAAARTTAVDGGVSARPRVPRPRPARHPSPAPRRRFKGQYVAIGAGGALVAALVGVGIYQDSRRNCVDQATQTIVDDSECRTVGHGAHWYYGGRGGGIGQKAIGGSYERGGFGRFFSGGG